MINPACPECGNETDTYMGWGTTTGRDHWYCEHCNKIQPIPGRHERQDNAEEAFHDTRREDWEREQYRRLDAEDRAELDEDTDAG